VLPYRPESLLQEPFIVDPVSGQVFIQSKRHQSTVRLLGVFFVSGLTKRVLISQPSETGNDSTDKYGILGIAGKKNKNA
jgi:hypothetical protein